MSEVSFTEQAISPAEELSALGGVLASRTFARAKNAASLLNYVCQEHAAGRAGTIKEYNIAVSALGRDSDFDPGIDSAVRVEVSRLRKRLQEFYAGEGASQPIEIRLSEIGYAPRFLRKDAVSGPMIAIPSELVPRMSTEPPAMRLRIAWLAGALILLTGISVGVLRAHRPALPSAKPLSDLTPTPTPFLPAEGSLRIAVGSSSPRYVDRSGEVWLGDRYFKGGNAISKPDHRIGRTLDPALYQEAREGEFEYDIPLKQGAYELHLHFAEIVARENLGSGPEGLRRFSVYANNRLLLNDFDITLDSPGADTADVRVFTGISPDPNGRLHLRFTPIMGKPILAGIELLPNSGAKLLPVRVLTTSRALYDHRDQFWGADRFFSGGRSLPRLAKIQGTDDPGLFASERFGSFSYFVPVAPGSYKVTLYFAESNFGVDNIGSPTYAAGKCRQQDLQYLLQRAAAGE